MQSFRDPEIRKQLSAEAVETEGTHEYHMGLAQRRMSFTRRWDLVQVYMTLHERNKPYSGKSIEQIARALGVRDQGVVVRQPQYLGHASTGGRDHRLEDVVPFVVHHPGGVLPGPQVGVMGNVGPRMVGVGCGVEPVRVSLQEPLETVFQHS